MMAMAEPLPSGEDDAFEDVFQSAKWKIDEVFDKRGVHTNKALERGWQVM